MTLDQISKYEMYERLIKFCNEDAATVALIAPFKTHKETLESKLPIIFRLSGLIDAENAHAENKLNMRMSMIALGLDVCANLNGYGRMMKDTALISMGDHSKSSLNKGKELDVEQRCQGISDKARLLLTELTNKLGMQEALLTQFEASIAQYKAIKTQPRTALQAKSNSIADLNSAFDEADLAYSLMVSGVVNFKNIASDFIPRFNNATTIIAPRVSTTKIKFEVTNGITKEKITDYHVESIALNVGKTLIAAKSSAMPTAHHKQADFVISREGFEPASVEKKKITKGKINIIKVKLMPIQG